MISFKYPSLLSSLMFQMLISISTLNWWCHEISSSDIFSLLDGEHNVMPIICFGWVLAEQEHKKLKCLLYVHVCIYHLKIVLEDSKTWSDISNKAILPCLNCVRAPESEREVVIIDFGIIQGVKWSRLLGPFQLHLLTA